MTPNEKGHKCQGKVRYATKAEARAGRDEVQQVRPVPDEPVGEVGLVAHPRHDRIIQMRCVQLRLKAFLGDLQLEVGGDYFDKQFARIAQPVRQVAGRRMMARNQAPELAAHYERQRK